MQICMFICLVNQLILLCIRLFQRLKEPQMPTKLLRYRSIFLASYPIYIYNTCQRYRLLCVWMWRPSATMTRHSIVATIHINRRHYFTSLQILILHIHIRVLHTVWHTIVQKCPLFSPYMMSCLGLCNLIFTFYIQSV